MKAISSNAVHVDLDLAESLFGQLERATRRGSRIVRDSYGSGEQVAHDIVRAAGERIGLEVAIDSIGNLAMTLPGKDRRAPRILIGSHLDSVPQGGNFDGAAGVVAGLCALSTLRQAGDVPACDIGVMAIRMDPRLRSCLMSLLERPMEMPSGAGHDAAVFAKMGIPSAMIFVRNDHGSHNPEEAMTLEDFAVGTRALVGLLQRFPL